ncbi:MAG: DUF2865 domain-containing protein [Cucumibacter sp.]
MKLRVSAKSLAIVLAFCLATPALAQTDSCNQLDQQLRALERDRDFRNVANYAREARSTKENLQRLESAFVRTGCQRAVNAGDRLTRDCRALANQITRTRADYAELVEHANRGAQVAQLREEVLQQVARFGCNNQGAITFGEPRPAQTANRGGLLERLFGRLGLGGNDFIGDQWGYTGASTLRTVCVRACDGYFWPVSYSTLSEFLTNDAAVCSQQCPMGQVDLYYYRNPGEEPESMVNLAGQRYADLPNAFRYREQFDAACACEQRINYGTIQLAGADGAVRQATVEFGDQTFPMPRRDPRRTIEIAVSTAEFVPMPRRRPALAGEPVVALPVPMSTADLRLVKFGDKTVRIVGPDTPYVPTPEAGS